MASARPSLLDLRAQSQTSVSQPLKSPRLHIAGEIPPELSPLDAFAQQSRLLAKQLEESAKAGRRVSRLPPLTTSSPLIVQGRSEYFRSLSHDSFSSDNETGESPVQSSSQIKPPSQPMTPSGKTPEVEEPSIRPQSMHPRMSRIPPTPDENAAPPIPDYSRGRQNFLMQSNASSDGRSSLYGARRDRSPSPYDEEAFPAAQSNLASSFSSQTSHSPQPSQRQQQPNQPPPTSQQLGMASSTWNPLTQSPERMPVKKSSFDLTANNSGGLAPPRQVFPKRSSSIMSSPLEITDEDGHNYLRSSFHSQGASRNLSNSSGMISPGLYGSFHRSPSMSSDMSAPLPRPSFNFSRPLSRAGTPGLESPARQASSDSQTSYSQSSFVFTDDTSHTPTSMHSEGFADPSTSTALEDSNRAAAPSYVYSKFSLPRGKIVQRSNPLTADNHPQVSYQWEQPIVQPSNVQVLPLGGQAPPSPPTRPSSSSGFLSRPSLERSKLSTEVLVPPSEPSPGSSRPPTDGGCSLSEEAARQRPLTSPVHESSARSKTPMSSAASTSDAASTIKARSMHSLATAIETSAEEHVDKAISLHERGQLNESTYHLRHAARQGHPTGMLLYALACRHGWGMRANPREGAEWLRKAADCASLEIADDEALVKEGKLVDSVDRKTRKAQFALSIYELGVSYMNGWGIDQDKSLALRCFEIAGSWGDVDALAEAGFCYAQGIGCKKDLKTSAKFYRQAEAKGMSMVGNSWIHKSKYNEDKDPKPKKEKGARSKSRSRNIFGKKHSSKDTADAMPSAA